MSEFTQTNALNDITQADMDVEESEEDSRSNLKDNLPELMLNLDLNKTSQNEESINFTDEEIVAIKLVYDKLSSENFPVEKLSWPEIGMS